MTFAAPLALIALVGVPLLIRWYAGQQRRRARAAEAFAVPAMMPSVAPWRPRWRRHAPMLALLLALVLLVIAAARPQRTVAVPLTGGAILLANDVSTSMTSTDVSPSRVGAAKRAAAEFIDAVPGTIEIGVMEFARTPVVLQSPTTDHAQAKGALSEFHTSGGTAMNAAIETAVDLLTGVPGKRGRRPPAAVVLLSDGGANVGPNPFVAAQQAKAQHIPIYTIALGTAHGTIPIKRGSQVVNLPVPVSTEELERVAAASGGRAFTVRDMSGLRTVYAHLAAQLGHKHVKHEVSASFAAGALVVLLFGSVLSLRWFGRLI